MSNLDVLSPLEGLVPLLVGHCCACLLQHFQSQRQLLTYQVELMPTYVARRHPDDHTDAEHGNVADTLYSCGVAVQNSGNTPLSNQSLVVELEESVTILEEQPPKTVPDLEFGEIRVDKELSSEWKRGYIVELINEGDKIRLDFVVAGDLNLPDVVVRDPDGTVKCLRKRTYAFRRTLSNALRLLMVILIVVGLLATLAFQSRLTPCWAQAINRIVWNGMVPAVLGVVLARVEAPLKAPRKRLSYEIAPLRPLPDHDLTFCRVVLWNTGNRPLRNQSVLLWLQGANILRATIRGRPKPIRVNDDLGDQRRYYFSEWPHKRKVTIDVLFEGRLTSEDIRVAARGEGLEVVCEKGWNRLTFWHMALIGIVIMVIGILPASFYIGVLIAAVVVGMDSIREFGYLVYDLLAQAYLQMGLLKRVLIVVIGSLITINTVLEAFVWWRTVTALFRPRKASYSTGNTPAQVHRGCVNFILVVMMFACIATLLIGILLPWAQLGVLQALGLLS